MQASIQSRLAGAMREQGMRSLLLADPENFGYVAGPMLLINGMKTSGKKRDNLGSIGKSFRRGCNSIAESATKKEGNQPSFFVGG